MLAGSRNLESVFDKSRSLVFAWFVFAFFESRNFLPRSLLDKLWDASHGISPFIQIKWSCTIRVIVRNKGSKFLHTPMADQSRGLRESCVQSLWRFHFRRFNSQSDHEFSRPNWNSRETILASDEKRGHMGESKNEADRRLNEKRFRTQNWWKDLPLRNVLPGIDKKPRSFDFRIWWR